MRTRDNLALHARMQACMHARTHACTHTHARTHVRACTHTHTHYNILSLCRFNFESVLFVIATSTSSLLCCPSLSITVTPLVEVESADEADIESWPQVTITSNFAVGRVGSTVWHWAWMMKGECNTVCKMLQNSSCSTVNSWGSVNIFHNKKAINKTYQVTGCRRVFLFFQFEL